MTVNYPTWYPEKKYSKKEERYFKMIENVFKIQLGDNTWDKIKLCEHQKDFHANDITIKGSKALYDVVEKSRNTSFTINSIIRLATGNYRYRDEIVPLNRISEEKVKELIDEAYKIIQHMTPIRLEICPACHKLKKSLFNNNICTCGSKEVVYDYWPFNPKIVKKKALTLKFPDRKVIWKGYGGLSPTTAEIVRGVRSTRGLMDEVNYIRYFKEIYTAMRDSSRGAVLKDGNFEEENVHHQLTIGSTLKGFTKFYYWLEDIRKKIGQGLLKKIRILSWPVFEKRLFNPEKPFDNWSKLITIVPWHTLHTMKEKINEDIYTFLEEYMAIVTPDNLQLYNIAEIQDLSNSKPLAERKNILKQEFPPGIYYGGADPAGEGGHFFSISIFREDPDTGIKNQIYLDQEKHSDLTEREVFIQQLLDIIPFTKFRIDGNGLAYQMSQNLKKNNPSIVEVFRGGVKVKTVNKQTISINEYLHTNQIILIKNKKVNYIDDELQLKQFAGWNRKYKAEEGKEIGHCDSTISNGLALLPINWKVAGRTFKVHASNVTEESSTTMKDTKKDLKDFYKGGLKDRIKYYKKNKRFK